MKARVILKGQLQRERAHQLVDETPLDPLHEISVSEYTSTRSLQQNALYWKWNTVIAQEQGETKDDIHLFHKEKFAIHIFVRDDESFRRMMQAINTLNNFEYHLYREALGKIVELTQTTAFSVAQFTEYLNEIDRFWMIKGLYLPVPQHLNIMIKDFRPGGG